MGCNRLWFGIYRFIRSYNEHYFFSVLEFNILCLLVLTLHFASVKQGCHDPKGLCASRWLNESTDRCLLFCLKADVTTRLILATIYEVLLIYLLFLFVIGMSGVLSSPTLASGFSISSVTTEKKIDNWHCQFFLDRLNIFGSMGMYVMHFRPNWKPIYFVTKNWANVSVLNTVEVTNWRNPFLSEW